MRKSIYVCAGIFYTSTQTVMHTHTHTYIYLFYKCSRSNSNGFLCVSLPSISLWGWLSWFAVGWLAGGSALFCWYCCVVVGVVGVLEPGWRWAEGKKVWKYNIWVPRAIQSPQDISTYKMLAHTLKQTHIRTHTRSTGVQQVHVIVTERSLSIEVVLELNARWMSCGIN